MTADRTVPRYRQAQDVGRTRDPPARRRQDLDQRPDARGLLPARLASHGGARRRSKTAGADGTYDLRVRVHGGGISGQAGAVTARHRPCARRGRPGAACAAQARGLSSRATPARSSARRPGCTRPAKRRSSPSDNCTRHPSGRALIAAALAQSSRSPAFGGTVTTNSRPWLVLTSEPTASAASSARRSRLDLVERLGRAATVWSGRGRVFVGRDTRGSGPALEEALVRGIVCRRGDRRARRRAARRPPSRCSPRISASSLSASHNPPEYNGVKFFDAAGPQAHRRGRGGDRGAARHRRSRAAARSRLPSPPPRATSTTSLRALRYRALRPSDRGRLRERRLLGDRAGRLRAARRGRDDGRERRPTGRTSTSAAARPISALLQDVVRNRRLRPRRRLRRRRRPHARGRRDGAAARRRPDRRRARARARRRHGRGDDDDESRLPPADGRSRHSRAHDRRRRPARAGGAARARARCSAASSPDT